MVIRKRPELDTVNPPGQWVNPELKAVAYKPAHAGYPGEVKVPSRAMLLSPRTCGCKQCDNSCMHD